MKQAKRNAKAESMAESVAVSANTSAVELPDIAYVEQLLAVSESVAQPTISRVIKLPTQCQLRDTVEFKQQLMACLDSNSVEIDVAAVTRVDTAFMQLLTVFVRSYTHDNRSIKWLNINAVFAEATMLLGLQSALKVPDLSLV
ncbi:MAG: lipid asymmetry maintenance protein MlaB [Steroidobacteraceae bacterium]